MCPDLDRVSQSANVRRRRQFTIRPPIRPVCIPMTPVERMVWTYWNCESNTATLRESGFPTCEVSRSRRYRSHHKADWPNPHKRSLLFDAPSAGGAKAGVPCGRQLTVSASVLGGGGTTRLRSLALGATP